MKAEVLTPVFGRSVEIALWRGAPQFVPLRKGE
jgi:hypothetical protein